MHKDDIDHCIKISKEVFGSDYHHPIYFELANKNHHYFVAQNKNKIIGFSILYKVSKDEMNKITNKSFKLTYAYYSLIDVIAITKNM